jgi:hypothetical protein
MKAVLVLAVALVAGGTAIAGLDPAVRMTLDGVGGACPGMSVAAVSARWGVRPAMRCDRRAAPHVSRGRDRRARDRGVRVDRGRTFVASRPPRQMAKSLSEAAGSSPVAPESVRAR